MAKGYRIIEGIAMADLAFEATGENPGELFEHSAMAVESAQVDLKTVKQVITKDISLEKASIEDLLHEFLSELVYLKDAEQLLFSKANVSISRDDLWALHAKLTGDKINDKMKLGTDVKAITLHEFSVKEDKTGWTARFVVDV